MVTYKVVVYMPWCNYCVFTRDPQCSCGDSNIDISAGWYVSYEIEWFKYKCLGKGQLRAIIIDSLWSLICSLQKNSTHARICDSNNDADILYTPGRRHPVFLLCVLKETDMYKCSEQVKHWSSHWIYTSLPVLICAFVQIAVSNPDICQRYYHHMNIWSPL